MKYSSNAKWTNIPDSKDFHDTLEQAEGVCDMLMEKWGEGNEPCPERGNVLETWVIDELKVKQLQEELKSKNTILHPEGEYTNLSFAQFFIKMDSFESGEFREFLVERFFNFIKEECQGDFKLCFTGNYGESFFDKDLANQVLEAFNESSMSETDKYSKAVKTGVLGVALAQDKHSFIQNIEEDIAHTLFFEAFFQGYSDYDESLAYLIKYIKDNNLV